MTEPKIKKHLVAVYGSLLKDLYNHKYYLEDSKLVGEFDSEPIYSLYDMGSFPALKEGGYTSVKMEVYEISTLTLKKLDTLEGFKPNEKHNHYNRVEIITPYGKAYTYIHNQSVRSSNQVLSGNWRDYYKSKQIVNV